MTHKRCICRLTLAMALATTATPAAAFFHQWRFTEFFSNADGSVQFIEMHTTGSGETVAQGSRIVSTGSTFNFDRNLTGPTTNRRLLIATADFEAHAGGVEPDFILPPNFFDPAGDTLRLCTSTCTGGNLFDSKTFGGMSAIAPVPTDGVMSLNFPPASGLVQANSPTNYDGASGSVDLSTPPMPVGDFNGDDVVDAADYTVWRDGLGDPFDEEDFLLWKATFGAVVDASSAGISAVPEPTGGALLLAAACAAVSRSFSRRTRTQGRKGPC